MAVKNKSKMRNLVQYRNMSDEEFNSVWETYSNKPEVDVDSRTEKIMTDLSLNYDLRDMNVNDTLALRELAKTFVLLDDIGLMEQSAFEDGELSKLSTLSKIKKEYLENVSKLQNDLNIARKNRQGDVEALESYLPSILKKAKNFLDARLAYIYCPECHMLVANAWFNNWNLENKIELTCPREECNHRFDVTSQYLAANRNKNVEGVLHV